MLKEKNLYSCMFVSANPSFIDFFTTHLPLDRFYPITKANSAGEAKRLMVDRSFDLVFINTPLPDDFGAKLAIDISRNQTCGILVFVKADVFDAVSQKLEDFGILTLGKPINRQLVFQSIKLLMATRQKIRQLEEKASSLQNKMEEIRLINRAKLLLMQRLNMSESEAHRYIEKTAMDSCKKRSDIAIHIIKLYEN